MNRLSVFFRIIVTGGNDGGYSELSADIWLIFLEFSETGGGVGGLFGFLLDYLQFLGGLFLLTVFLLFLVFASKDMFFLFFDPNLFLIIPNPPLILLPSFLQSPNLLLFLYNHRLIFPDSTLNHLLQLHNFLFHHILNHSTLFQLATFISQ